MSNQLCDALLAVSWQENVEAFCREESHIKDIHSAIAKIAMLARQIQVVEDGNPALPFVHEMQLSGHDVVRCISLSLYKPAVSAMRSMLECAIYYCYFRSHPVELKTLVRDEKFYLSKSEIIDYFQIHVEGWKKKQSAIALVSRLDSWYSKVSAIIHGQIPGHWNKSLAISDSSHSEELLRDTVSLAVNCADISRDVVICSFMDEVWRCVETDAKRELLHGTSADYREKLKLDRA
ncbi:hypothetical protein QEG11_003317 [Stenotrophomonas maltophilia]|nr:hypothetical protein [Stenotrophomonas maltophilia]